MSGGQCIIERSFGMANRVFAIVNGFTIYTYYQGVANLIQTYDTVCQVEANAAFSVLRQTARFLHAYVTDMFHFFSAQLIFVYVADFLSREAS